MLKENEVKNLPSTPGVYLFLKNNKPVYIGKATNIKARISSHFKNSLLNEKARLIIDNADKIDYFLTSNDFNSLLLEAKLIKKYQPIYNVRQKDDKSFLYLAIDKNELLPKVRIIRKTDIQKNLLVFGPFSSQKIVQTIVRLLRKIIPFCTQKKLSKKPCFYSKIGLCNPCPNQIVNIDNKEIKEKLIKQYQENIKKLIKILKGNLDSILKETQIKLKNLIKNQQYEEAIDIRNKLNYYSQLINIQFYDEEKNYQEINNQAVKELIEILKKEHPLLKKLIRIEAYDISNLGEKIIVGSMVCFINGIPDKSEYRRFRIEIKNKQSDSQRLVEVLKRRFKKDWPLPDLLIIDGGKPQLELVNRFLKEIQVNIPVLGIAKNPDKLILGKNFKKLNLKLNHLAFNLVRQIRDEAHRFAKKYYLILSKKYYKC